MYVLTAYATMCAPCPFDDPEAIQILFVVFLVLFFLFSSAAYAIVYLWFEMASVAYRILLLLTSRSRKLKVL